MENCYHKFLWRCYRGISLLRCSWHQQNGKSQDNVGRTTVLYQYVWVFLDSLISSPPKPHLVLRFWNLQVMRLSHIFLNGREFFTQCTTSSMQNSNTHITTKTIHRKLLYYILNILSLYFSWNNIEVDLTNKFMLRIKKIWR